MLVITGQADIETPAQGIPPAHGRGAHVQAGDQVGADDHPPRQHPRDRAQGRASSRAPRSPAPATSSCPRTSRRWTPTTEADRSRDASAARSPTTRSSTGPSISSARPSARSSSPATACIRKRASKQLRLLLREDRHRRGQHLHGEGLRRHGCRLLPLHHRPAGDGPRRLRDRRRRPRDHARLRHGRVPPAPVELRTATSAIIHVDFLPAEIDANYHPEVEVVGDLAHTLWMLNERLEAHGMPAFDLDQQHAARRAMAADFARHKDDDTEGSIRPQKALWDARQVLGPRRHPALRRRRPQDVDRPLLPVPRAEHLPDPERLLLDGLRPARRDRRRAGAARSGASSPSAATPAS